MQKSIQRVASRWLMASTSTIIETLLAKVTPSLGPDWKEFHAEVAALLHVLNDEGRLQGDPDSLLRWISIEAGLLGPHPKSPSPRVLYQQWDAKRQAVRAKAEHAAYLDSTYAVQLWTGSKWGKPARIPKEDAGKPWKNGCVLLDTRTKMEGHGFDSDFGATLSTRSLVIGAEVPQGTVSSKRLVERPEGRSTQYCIQPRSARKQKAYIATLELSDLEARLRVSSDWLTPEDRKRLQEEISALVPVAQGAALGPIVR